MISHHGLPESPRIRGLFLFLGSRRPFIVFAGDSAVRVIETAWDSVVELKSTPFEAAR